METKKQFILGLGRKKFSFSRVQQHQIVQDYLTSSLSKREIWEKYTGEKEEHGQIYVGCDNLVMKQSLHSQIPLTLRK